MSYRMLPPTFSADLLKRLSANQFVAVTLIYGMEGIASRIAGDAADDLSGWEVIMERIRALPPSPTDKMTWSEIQARKNQAATKS